MGVSRVDYGGNTLIDLTNDSVSVDTLAKGITAHNAAGEQVTGTMEAGTSVTKESITEALGYTPTKAWYVAFTTNIDDNSATADKTVAEIYQAYQDGYAVYGYVTNGIGILSLEAISSGTASFTIVDVYENGMLAFTISWDADNSKWVTTVTNISSSDTAQSPLIVNITQTSSVPSGEVSAPASSDTTIDQIYEAFNAGRLVFASINEEKIPLIQCSSTSAVFAATAFDGEAIVIQVEYDSSSWKIYSVTLSNLYATRDEIPDETTLVNKVLAALPTWTGGSY